MVILGFTVHADLHGLTSHVRASINGDLAYGHPLDLFRSTAFNINTLAEYWNPSVAGLFEPLDESGHLVLVADGLMLAKEGHRMPAIQSLYQDS